jgi:hypothetical protein
MTGATIGGPVWIPKVYNGKNKTFFFFAYEGFRFKTGGNGTITLPNEDFRKGDFSGICNAGFTNGLCNNPNNQLYDPTTHSAIPGDVLTNDPNFTPSKVTTNVFALLPPTTGALTNNVSNPTINSTTANLYDVKIDHIAEKHRILGSYDNTKTRGASDLGPIFGQSVPQNTRYVRISDNYVFSPTVVNQALFGFSRRFRGEIANSLGQNYPEKIGLTGVQQTTFPCFNWDNFSSALSNCNASQFADNVYQINDAVSWVKGKHSFKFGGEIRMLQFNVRRLQNTSGALFFDAAQTSSNGTATGVGGASVASSLFGLSNTTNLSYGTWCSIQGFRDVRAGHIPFQL